MTTAIASAVPQRASVFDDEERLQRLLVRVAHEAAAVAWRNGAATGFAGAGLGMAVDEVLGYTPHTPAVLEDLLAGHVLPVPS